jgi:hypothetical protein
MEYVNLKNKVYTGLLAIDAISMSLHRTESTDVDLSSPAEFPPEIKDTCTDFNSLRNIMKEFAPCPR